MDPNAAVLEISSDEDDDHNWLTALLGDENKEINGDEVVVVKERKKPVKKPELKSCLVELDDDCVVLDEDPNAIKEVRKDGSGNGDDDDDGDDDVVVVSEKGQVACRDYPHSRHLCIKFPFSSTPNQSHCDQCYCYVCDSLAPCVFWGNGSASPDHCHATDKDQFWVLERKTAKNGGKPVQPVSQLTPVDLYSPPPLMGQPQNPVHANHTLANFQSPNIMSQYRNNNILASRNKLHPDLSSQLMRRVPLQQRFNVNSRVHRPVLKRTGPVRVHRPLYKTTGPVRAATANQNHYSLYRGNLVNPIRQQRYQVNSVNTSVPYHPQNQTYVYASSTVNQPNPNFQPLVNSNPVPENPFYRVPVVPPLSSLPQPRSSQQAYMMPVQSSYHVPSKTQVDSPLVPVSSYTQNSNTSQGNQSQGTIVEPGFKDNGLGLPTGQDSATLEPGSATNGGLADYQFDWLFDNQPIEPGFTDYSSDSAYIDTGPIFEF